VLWSNNSNKWVFNRRLNCPRLSDCLSSVGKELHTRGPATAKHLSPWVVRVRRTALWQAYPEANWLARTGNSYSESIWTYKIRDFAKIVMPRPCHIKILSWFQVWATAVRKVTNTGSLRRCLNRSPRWRPLGR